MKSKVEILILLSLFNILICKAQKKVEIMQPKVEFDIKLATDMLNDGNANIKGVAYYEGRSPIGIKSSETIYARMGEKVFLYPLTPYIEEYLQLKKKNKEGKRIATISPLANCYRIESKVYTTNGEFIFTGLKPGKYYLEVMVLFPSGTGGREASGIVEIKSENETVEYKLKYIF